MSETGDQGGASWAERLQPNAEMAALRLRIDALDEALVRLLAERQRQIERRRRSRPRIGWPARIPPRVDEVLERVAAEREGRKSRCRPGAQALDRHHRMVDRL